MITDEMVEAARSAIAHADGCGWECPYTDDCICRGQARAALAAVLPAVRRAERERCIAAVQASADIDGPFKDLAEDAIRAMEDETP